MYRLFFTPEWFNGWDIAFDLIILVVAMLIAGYSWRVYQINKENKFAYFSLAFVFVAIGMLSKSFSSGVLYFTSLRDVTASVLAPVVGPKLSLSHLYYRASFFFQMASFLGAWLLIFFISQKSRARLRKLHEVTQIALFIYLVLLISIVSNFSYFVFYLTSMVLLGLIVLNYYKNYLNTKNKNTFRVMLAFIYILVGNIFFVFVFLFQSLYVLGELFMLLGFLQLLLTYARVRRK
jgi:hypothetical protein